MDRSNTPLPKPLEAFRSYLIVLARARLHPMVRAKLDASDIVQETLLDAHAAREGFRGETSGEQAAWLQQILARNLANALRDLRRKRRDVARERSLDAAIERSSSGLEGWLAAEQSSPSVQAVRHEEMLRLANDLAALPEAQQEALVLRHWQGWSLADISEAMGRSPQAVAGLIQRGLRALRSDGRERHRGREE